MTKRSNRLRLVVKQSGKTAKELINTFEEIEKNDRNGAIKYPKDPITISRHINAKRSFDIDMAVAYGKALDRDPADICFEPVYKTIWGEVNPKDGHVKWFTNTDGITVIEPQQVRVPREFFGNQYKVVDIRDVRTPVHNTLLIYKQTHELGNQVNRKYFDTLSIIGYSFQGSKQLHWCNGIATPITKNKFIIKHILFNDVIKDVTIHKIYPIVSAIHPAFYDDFSNN